jgi:hypothetical protein
MRKSKDSTSIKGVTETTDCFQVSAFAVESLQVHAAGLDVRDAFANNSRHGTSVPVHKLDQVIPKEITGLQRLGRHGRLNRVQLELGKVVDHKVVKVSGIVNGLHNFVDSSPGI